MNTTDRQAALDYHQYPTPGKITVNASKPLVTQRDLTLAYTPGVAAACEEIVADPLNAYRYTARGNLVGVITNGSDEIATRRETVRIERIGDDLFTSSRHAGCVGQREVALGDKGFAGVDGNFSGGWILVVIQGGLSVCRVHVLFLFPRCAGDGDGRRRFVIGLAFFSCFCAQTVFSLRSSRR